MGITWACCGVSMWLRSNVLEWKEPVCNRSTACLFVLPDCIAAETLDCCVYSLCYCLDRRSRQSPTVFSTVVDMMSLRAHANSMVNHDAPVSWPPSVYLALHHSPIYDHLFLVAFAISFESFSNKSTTERENKKQQNVKFLVERFLGIEIEAQSIPFYLYTVYFETKRVSPVAIIRSFQPVALSSMHPVWD